MKQIAFTLLVILSLTLIQGCDKKPERMDDFLAEFATVIKQGDTYRFKLDNGKVLSPIEVKDFHGSDGDRVILYWTPLNGDKIEIKNITPVFSGDVLFEGYPENYKNDPLKIISVWVEGDYLNLILEIEYHSTPHTIALYKDTSTEGTDLYLSHSMNNDPPGYFQIMYASFRLSKLKSLNETEVPFRLFIYSNKELRQFNFTLVGAC
ncbi:NigD1/NigD2 family lipoprotein [Lascolabacillus massiliensis]|uniref:NigD1/NigD2 family lipoprotein n=1 Tax=Lascolabacillus massiliensis TaxID=1627894 RepID=UPI0006B39BD5|nr:NigD-like C-terminal domain-containing protein [Lascolabacillus massiliensis]